MILPVEHTTKQCTKILWRRESRLSLRSIAPAAGVQRSSAASCSLSERIYPIMRAMAEVSQAMQAASRTYFVNAAPWNQPNPHLAEQEAVERAEAAWHRVHAAARRATDTAIAVELLPTIFGGEWQTAAADPCELLGIDQHTIHGLSLLANGSDVVFVPKHAPDRPSLSSAVLVGQPCVDLGANSDPNGDVASECARYLTWERGVSVWASAELSTFWPGDTMLVLIARGLPADPTTYGFVDLAAST